MSSAIKVSWNLVDIVVLSETYIAESQTLEFGIPMWNLHAMGGVDVGNQLLIIREERGSRNIQIVHYKTYKLVGVLETGSSTHRTSEIVERHDSACDSLVSKGKSRGDTGFILVRAQKSLRPVCMFGGPRRPNDITRACGSMGGSHPSRSLSRLCDGREGRGRVGIVQTRCPISLRCGVVLLSFFLPSHGASPSLYRSMKGEPVRIA